MPRLKRSPLRDQAEDSATKKSPAGRGFALIAFIVVPLVVDATLSLGGASPWLLFVGMPFVIVMPFVRVNANDPDKFPAARENFHARCTSAGQRNRRRLFGKANREV
jgi:hypothetical protein